MSLFSKKNLIAISFHDTELRIVCMDADHKIESAQSTPLPAGALQKGQIKDAVAIAGTLQKAIESLPSKPEGTLLVLPDEQCFVRRFQVESTLKDAALESSIIEQAKKSIPVDHDWVYFDYQGEGVATVLYASAFKATIDEYKKLFDAAKIPLHGVAVEGLGLGSALLGQVPATAEGAKASLIVTIGDDTAAINAFSANRELLFSSIVPFSGGHFTQTIIKSLSVQGASATVPVSLQITADAAQQSVLQIALQSIVLEISKAATYAETSLAQPIGVIVLAGDLALIPGIDGYFSSLLNKPVIIGSLAKGNEAPVIFAGEIGALLEFFGADGKSMNLLRHGGEKSEVRSEKTEAPQNATPHPGPLPEGEGAATPASSHWKKIIAVIFVIATLAGLGFIVYKYLFMAL